MTSENIFYCPTGERLWCPRMALYDGSYIRKDVMCRHVFGSLKLGSHWEWEHEQSWKFCHFFSS